MKVCIIGGGLSGTIACKYCKERGHRPIILEKTNNIGGVYSLLYDKNNYQLSSSKFITSFSDFLPNKNVSVWMKISEFQNYIYQYIIYNQLLSYFNFNINVLRVEHFSNYVLVTYQNLKTNQMIKEKYDKVIVATGLNQNPKYKNIDGIETFTGLQLHTHDIYTNPQYNPKQIFKDKTILILGGGESSFDIGHECYKYGNKVYYHTDNDVEWFPEGGLEVDTETEKKYDKCFNDMYPAYYGKENMSYFSKNSSFKSAPNDTLLTRAEYSLNPLYSEIWQSKVARDIYPANFDNRCSHGVKELCKNPKRNIFDKYLVKRSKFLCDIKQRDKITILRNPIYFVNNKLLEKFKIKDNHNNNINKNQFIDKIDIIIYATGYRPKFEFLPEEIKTDQFIKNIIPKKHPNIAFIGFTRPTMGSILIMSETQTMWTMLYFENKLNYQIRDNSIVRSINPLNLNNQYLRHLVIGNYYMDDLAKDMNNNINLIDIYFKDRELWYYLFYGMVHPINYRLKGEYYHPNARNNLIQFYKQTFDLRGKGQRFFIKTFVYMRIIYTILIILFLIIIYYILFKIVKKN